MYIDAVVLLIQVNTVNYSKDLTSADLKPMSITKLRHRASSIIIYEENQPQWSSDTVIPPLESQLSFMDLNSPILEPVGQGALVA